MEPPSSVNKDSGMSAVTPADDPLSDNFTGNTYLIVTSSLDENGVEGYVVCGYSPLTGLSYIGTGGSVES